MRTLLISYLAIFLLGVLPIIATKKFTTCIKGPSFTIRDIKFYLNLDPTSVNATKTRGCGPWLLSFDAYTTKHDYSELIIESAVFTDSKNNQITLIQDDNPVRMLFSPERLPAGKLGVSYYSKDREPLDFEFLQKSRA